MNKLLAMIVMVPCVMFGALRYDPATRTFQHVPDDPELQVNADRNELQLKRRLAALKQMRGDALARTNYVSVVVRPGDVRLKGRRVFSKMKLVSALMRIGRWAEVKAWIEANGLTDLYLAAQDVREDNEYFIQAVNDLKLQLGVDDAALEQLLLQCAAE